MRFLRTKLGTNWPTELEAPSLKWKVLGLVTRFIPEANPDYVLHPVREWLIEFDDDGLPWREIGLDDSGEPVLAGPNDRNYGFWLDTNMRFEDFSGEEVSADMFEATWQRWRGWRAP